MRLTKRIARWYKLRRFRKKADAMSHEDFLKFITTVDSEIVLAYMGTIDRTKSVLHDFSRNVWGHSIASQLRYGVGWQVMGFSRKRIAKNDIILNGNKSTFLVLSVEYYWNPSDMFKALVVGYKE